MTTLPRPDFPESPTPQEDDDYPLTQSGEERSGEEGRMSRMENCDIIETASIHKIVEKWVVSNKPDEDEVKSLSDLKYVDKPNPFPMPDLANEFSIIAISTTNEPPVIAPLDPRNKQIIILPINCPNIYLLRQGNNKNLSIDFVDHPTPDFVDWCLYYGQWMRKKMYKEKIPNIDMLKNGTIIY